MGKPFAEAIEEKIAEHPDWEKEIRMYWNEWDKMLGGIVEGMEEWICELKDAGYGLYGLSNWSTETFPLAKNKYRIFNLLDGTVMSGEEKIAKPDLRIYQTLLDRYGLKADECVFIDDRPENIAAAQKVGIHGIAFESYKQAQETFKNIVKQHELCK